MASTQSKKPLNQASRKIQQFPYCFRYQPGAHASAKSSPRSARRCSTEGSVLRRVHRHLDGPVSRLGQRADPCRERARQRRITGNRHQAAGKRRHAAASDARGSPGPARSAARSLQFVHEAALSSTSAAAVFSSRCFSLDVRGIGSAAGIGTGDGVGSSAAGQIDDSEISM